MHNNVLIRSGEARLVGWSRSMLYSGFNILPRSVFWSADFNGRLDNTDVIRLEMEFEAPTKIQLESNARANRSMRRFMHVSQRSKLYN